MFMANYMLYYFFFYLFPVLIPPVSEWWDGNYVLAQTELFKLLSSRQEADGIFKSISTDVDQRWELTVLRNNS